MGPGEGLTEAIATAATRGIEICGVFGFWLLITILVSIVAAAASCLFIEKFCCCVNNHAAFLGLSEVHEDPQSPKRVDHHQLQFYGTVDVNNDQHEHHYNISHHRSTPPLPANYTAGVFFSNYRNFWMAQPGGRISESRSSHTSSPIGQEEGPDVEEDEYDEESDVDAGGIAIGVQNKARNSANFYDEEGEDEDDTPVVAVSAHRHQREGTHQHDSPFRATQILPLTSDDLPHHQRGGGSYETSHLLAAKNQRRNTPRSLYAPRYLGQNNRPGGGGNAHFSSSEQQVARKNDKNRMLVPPIPGFAEATSPQNLHFLRSDLKPPSVPRGRGAPAGTREMLMTSCAPDSDSLEVETTMPLEVASCSVSGSSSSSSSTSPSGGVVAPKIPWDWWNPFSSTGEVGDEIQQNENSNSFPPSKQLPSAFSKSPDDSTGGSESCSPDLVAAGEKQLARSFPNSQIQTHHHHTWGLTPPDQQR